MSYVWEHVNGRPAVRRDLDDVMPRIRNEELAVTGYISERHSYLILRPWEDRHFPLFQKPVRHRQERPTTNLPPPTEGFFLFEKKTKEPLFPKAIYCGGHFVGKKVEDAVFGLLWRETHFLCYAGFYPREGGVREISHPLSKNQPASPPGRPTFI